jgi:prepilin signal peptidase PulO-like enzyme (type II secretory pathway)
MMNLFYIYVFVLGLIVGSFLNCLIWRLYKGESISGRSYCPHCRQLIAWYDNIPILSFFLLAGHCRKCREKISWQYPLVELAVGLLFLLTFRSDVSNPQFLLLLWRDWLLVAALMIVFVYDSRWQLIPISIIWPLGAVIFISNILLGLPFFSLLFFTILGAAFFFIQYVATKKRGVGEGDIWLGALLGASFPAFDKLLLIMVVSYGLGAIVSLVLMKLNRKNWQSRIALGPFLALAAIITLIWGQSIIAWYWGLPIQFLS